ncbi:MAG TPA: N-acyl homoserine lactonase family protein [Syntrophomonadaceae bacterium]|nr:N-acyl homoserine lactonase family protein [Syntrophomonadaceae bacterium]
MYYSIYPLFNGSFTVRLGENYPVIVKNVPSFTFLIIGDDQEPILVDTGFSNKFVPGVKSTCTKEPVHELSYALACLGYIPDDVTTVIQTHLHWDHTGGMQLFERARYLVQAEEFRSLINLGVNEECSFCTAHWINLLSRIQLIEGDIRIKPGLSLLWTGGHTRGHQAVSVRTKSGTVILGGDIPFNYDSLWSSIPDQVWQKYRTGYGKKFYWDNSIRSRIENWLGKKGFNYTPTLTPRSLNTLQSMSSQIYTSHDQRLLNLPCIS